MAKKEQVSFYLEQNRSGKLKKINVYKDKDKEDTTLTVWAKPPTGEVVKVGEYIFKEDQSNPPDCGPDQTWDPSQNKCVPKPPVENKPPTIEGPTMEQARVNQPITIELTIKDPEGGSVTTVWRQTLPTPKEYPDFANKDTATFVYDAEGDYTLQVSATDDKGASTDHLITIKARTVTPEPVSDFQKVLAFTGDDDSNKTGVASIKMCSKAPVSIFGGDGPYPSDANSFIDAWQSNVSIEHTALSERGNHDDTEDNTQAVKDAMDKYFSWGKIQNPVTKINNIGIIGIDTQDAKRADGSGDQFKFVSAALETLSQDKNLDFLVVVEHKPQYSHGYKHGDEKAMRSVYGPLFAKYKVDLVLQFHNHNFWHTFPLDAQGNKTNNEIPSSTSDVIYDFSGEHGTIYWGAGAGGHDLYKIGSSIPAYVRAWQDKDFGVGYIDIDKNNSKIMRVTNVNQAGKVLHSVIIKKGAGGQNGPPQRQPPQIAGGPPNDNMIVEPNGNVNIALNIFDQDGGTVDSIQWQFIPPVLSPTYTADKKAVTFQASGNEGDVSAVITATDNDGLSTSKTILIHIRKTPPADDFAGVEIFDSRKNWVPPDGKDHIIVAEVGQQNHKDGGGDMDGWIFPWPQPQATTYASHAHSAQDTPDFCIVTKEGHLKIKDNQHRTYTQFDKEGVGCYNFRDVTKIKWPSGIDNYSKKGRNRHEFHADNGKNGICGLGWALHDTVIESKKEIIHGQNEPVLLNDKSFGHTIKKGDIVTIQAIVFDEVQVSGPAKGKIWVRMMLYLDWGDGLKKVADYYDKSPSPAELNTDLYYNHGSAMWNRYNGPENAPEYVEILEEQIYDLGKEPRQASQ